MPLYKKKPIEVEAVQWNKPGDLMPTWSGLNTEPARDGLWIEAVGMWKLVEPGDYILRATSGSIMVCKPDVFEATYEPISVIREEMLPRFP